MNESNNADLNELPRNQLDLKDDIQKYLEHNKENVQICFIFYCFL